MEVTAMKFPGTFLMVHQVAVVIMPYAWLMVTILLTAMTHTVMAGMEIQRLSLVLMVLLHPLQ